MESNEIYKKTCTFQNIEKEIGKKNIKWLDYLKCRPI